MPDDFGELEREVFERIDEERAEHQRRTIRKAFEGIPEPPAPGTAVSLVDVFNDVWTAMPRKRAVVSPPGAGIEISTIELTPAEREALSTGGVRIPASPMPTDAIGLVDPADGTLKFYSRAEIRARVAARALGAPSTSLLRREVQVPAQVGLVGSLGRIYGQPDVINKRVLDFRVHDWTWLVLGAILATAAALGLYAIFSTISTDGRVTACYTWSEGTDGLLIAPRWNLYGRVLWRGDKRLGTFYSFEAAVAAAHTLGCPLDVPAKTPQ